jgi:hypothetical protein
LCRGGHTKACVIGDHADVGDFGIGKRQCRRIGNRLPDFGIWTSYGQQKRNAVQAVGRFGDHKRCLAARDCATRRQQNDRCQYQQLFELAC